MKKLSRKERKEIYLIIARQFEQGKQASQFLCKCFWCKIYKGYGPMDTESIYYAFPEFSLFKPVKETDKPKDAQGCNCWFGYGDEVKEQRIDCLLLCAAMTDNP